MSKIISTSELQKNIGKVAKSTIKDFITVTSRGKAKIVILPYFEDNDEAVSDYLETCEMQNNKEKLQKRYQKSLEDGLSDLMI